MEETPGKLEKRRNKRLLYQDHHSSVIDPPPPPPPQGTQNFGGIRVGNGPTEDQAEIIQHDQLSQHSEEEPEVRQTPHSSSQREQSVSHYTLK